MAKGKLAIILGVDGAGKSTVMRRLETLGFHTSHWRMVRQAGGVWTDLVDRASDTLQTLHGKERTGFLLKLLDAEWNGCILPRLGAPRDVVCDGFYLQMLAKELVLGDGDIGALLDASPLAGDELLVLIDVPAELALRRKNGRAISPYECFRSPADFLEFQASLREQLLAMVSGWTHVVVNGTSHENAVASEVADILENHGLVPSPR
jgi:thymidylate kinase